MLTRVFAIALAIVLTSNVAPSAAQAGDTWQAGARVNAVASENDDLSVAGALVTVRGTATTIRAAGAEVDVNASAQRDMWVAGAVANVTGRAGRDLRVAGARVEVNASVGRDLRAAGARLLIGPATEVAGRTSLAGADVTFAGTAVGPLRVYADTIRIEGRINGNLMVRGRSVTIASSAVIGGDAVFRTLHEPTIEDGATIAGQKSVASPERRARSGWRIAAGVAALALFGIGAGFVLGLILLIGGRPLVERAVDRVRVAPVRSLFIGLALLILVPIVAVLLLLTVIGIPVGILTLFAYPLLLFVGFVMAAFGLGDWLFNNRRRPRGFGGRLLLLLGGLVVLVVVGMIPFVGCIIVLLALLFGLGALWSAARAPTVAPAPG